MKVSTRIAALSSVALFALGAPVHAQTAAPQPADEATSAEDNLGLAEIVVTGASSGRRKMETSYAITTLSATDLQQRAPQSIAEVYASAPGIFAESSGGEIGNNVYSRGLPNDNFRYVPVLEDGLPVWEEGAGAFTNADIFYRVDATIQSAQIVRGGSASITASNAPGGVLNVLTKKGTKELEGLVKLEWGDYDHYRGDFSLTGPINDKLLFNVGGFYRANNGMRDPGFTGNRGGQFRAGLTYLLDDGQIYVGYRKLNDRNIFYTAIPLASKNNGLPGLDAGDGTVVSSAFRNIVAPDLYGTGSTSIDLANGVHTNTDTFTVNFDNKFNDWLSVSAKGRYTTGTVDFNGLFSDQVSGAQAFLDSALPALSAANAATVRAAYFDANTGQLIPTANIANGLTLVEDIFSTYVDVENLVGDLSFTAKNGNNTLTVGYYHSQFNQRQQWNWNNVLTEATNQPRSLDVIGLDAAGNRTIGYTANGLVKLHSNLQDFRDDVKIDALYATDSFQVTPALRIDLGARYHHVSKRGTIALSKSVNLGDPTTILDDNVTVLSGAIKPYTFSTGQWAFSAGANYEFNPNMAAFARYSRSFRVTPEFSQWFNCCNPVENRIDLLEGGLKYSSRPVSAFVTVFYNNFPNISFNNIVAGNPQTATAAARSYGVELELALRPVDMFELNFSGNIQSIKYTGFSGTDGNGAFDYSSNRIVRQPAATFSLRPVLHLLGNKLDVFSNIEYIGKRYADVSNTIALPAFTQVSLGAKWSITDNLSAEIIATNLFDTVGLTEGNPRAGVITGTNETAFQGRPIFGRRVRAGVTFQF
ncbi:TonB-dependent receptor domain-containing protein [Novosphingobium sp. MMS21-SN21R]|uniref:TonB-dependent siderophore receptor n=1 Tax=Novosphingobium sp. MMS21-SN21R TaxID=2969298 RepID=UPI00288490CF|nr:TonB-dependent receptor [Novosphingobium sp. MMS21-SN21R]MDT0507458.1 TonB-dependent receptor [Novosphingobium sp. MMS21-SN21R]